MGLLDSLFSGSQGGYGGLLDSLMYPSPLTQQQPVQQPQYDPMGGYTGITPQTAPDPFGPPPQMGSWAQQFAPPSPFTGTASAAPIQFAGGQMQPRAPALPSQQNVAAAPQVPQDMPTNNMQIGSGAGAYQMPQFGSAGDYTPQPQTAQAPSTDISAQSRAQQPQQELPPALGGSSILGRIGNPDGLIARLTGNDSRSIAQQNLSAQYHALRQMLQSNGDSPQDAASKAMIAVMNPKGAETIMPEVLSNKAKLQMVKDGFGGEKPYWADPNRQTLTPATVEGGAAGQAPGGAQPVFDAIAKARDSGATHQQMLEMVPSTLRAGVSAMLTGQAVPTYLSARGEARNTALMLAHTIDPTFDESQIGARLQGNKDFYGGGKSAETMRKTNQSALHFGELVDKMQTLPGSPVPLLNAGANLVNTQLLGKGEAGNFVTNAHALADELSSMFKGAGISDTEIRAWEQNLSPHMSAEQQRGMAKTLLGLYRDSVSALEKKRQESIGPVVSAQKGPILGPEAEAALQKVEQFAKGGSPPASQGAIPRSAVEAEMRRRGLMK